MAEFSWRASGGLSGTRLRCSSGEAAGRVEFSGNRGKEGGQADRA
jgi:hypothetical protein